MNSSGIINKEGDIFNSISMILKFLGEFCISRVKWRNEGEYDLFLDLIILKAYILVFNYMSTVFSVSSLKSL
jgi:hypothetical protein